MKPNDAKTTRKVDGLQEDIQRLKRRILAVGSLVETAIAHSITSRRGQRLERQAIVDQVGGRQATTRSAGR